MRPELHSLRHELVGGGLRTTGRESLRDGTLHGRCVPSRFRAAWWLSSPHLQTMWPTFFRTYSRSRPRARTPGAGRRRFHRSRLDDEILRPAPPRAARTGGMQSIPLRPGAGRDHARDGMAGHRHAPSGMQRRAQPPYPHLPLGRNHRSLHRVVRELRRREPDAPLCVAGYSLGGNVVLKWLGERGAGAEVDAAVAVSVPFPARRRGRSPHARPVPPLPVVPAAPHATEARWRSSGDGNTRRSTSHAAARGAR